MAVPVLSDHDDEGVTITPATVLRRADDVAVLEVAGDVAAIVESLRHRIPPPEIDDIPRTVSLHVLNEQSHATVESEWAGNLLRLLRRPCTVVEASARFCPGAAEIDGIPSQNVFAHTLKTLLERDLLCVAPAAEEAS